MPQWHERDMEIDRGPDGWTDFAIRLLEKPAWSR